MKLEQAAREVIRQHSMECLSDKTVDALREALAEQAEQEPVAEALRLSEEAIEYARQGGKIGSGIYGKALAAIRSAKEPQITTPDVCGEVCVRAKLCYGCGKALDEANAKFTEQAEQEPVAIDGLARACNLAGIDYKDFLRIKAYLPIAAPVRTKDLTDDELNALWYGNTKGGWIGLFRAVIAADREKNK